MASEKSRAVKKWITQLSEKDMPVFSGTVSEVTQVVNSEQTSASDVAHVVLRDASLTGRVLKAVNSFHFNPTSQAINTVSRAVMVMGFDQVRALTLSMVLVDNLGQGQQRQKLIEEMAQAFHAATQAQELAKMCQVNEPEDIFVATLLSRLGKMAFWAFADDQADRLMAEIDAGLDEHQAEINILGFPLSELTKALSQNWHLGDVVNDYLHGRIDKTRAACIDAGLELADLAKAGWGSEQQEAVIHRLAEAFGLDAEQLQARVYDNAQIARDITKLYGSYAASQGIPLPDQAEDTKAEPETEPEAPSDPESEQVAPGYLEPDPEYQMTVMQDITATVQERPGIGIVLEMVLEGIYKGVGTDRAMFAILNPEQSHLSPKYVMGDNADDLRQQLTIDVRRQENIFHQIITSQQARLLPGDPAALGGTLSRDTIRLLGTPPYMVAPVIVRNKVIGVFMADRKASGRELLQTDFLAFQQFCQQANMGLTILAMQG